MRTCEDAPPVTPIDDETAAFVAEKGAYIVPTMAIIFALRELGPSLGLPGESQEKLDFVFDQALSGMDRMRNAGVKIGFGTDLLGTTYTRQCTEFETRSEVFTPIEILRQATSINAELLALSGPRNPYPAPLGVIAPDAYADLLLINGDPLADISILEHPQQALAFIMKDGRIYKDETGSDPAAPAAPEKTGTTTREAAAAAR